MAKVTSSKAFWNIVKSVSIADIAREADRPLSVAVVGPSERREEALAALYAEEPGLETGRPRALPQSPFLQGFDAMTEAARFPRRPEAFDLVIDVGGGRTDAPEGARVYSLAELGGWQATLDRILDDRPELALALARTFPVFRPRVAQQIIQQTALANAQFALVTGVAESLPILAPLLPVNALSDMLIITKNQTMMSLRLAAAHGLPVDYKSRYRELLPILGNAFGWRAIARELVGIVPGVGFLARAAIAYAGTVTIGRAAAIYYQTGEQASAAQLRAFYREAYELGRERVRTLAASLRREKGGAQAALPAEDEELPALPPAEDENAAPLDDGSEPTSGAAFAPATKAEAEGRSASVAP